MMSEVSVVVSESFVLHSIFNNLFVRACFFFDSLNWMSRIYDLDSAVSGHSFAVVN